MQDEDLRTDPTSYTDAEGGFVDPNQYPDAAGQSPDFVGNLKDRNQANGRDGGGAGSGPGRLRRVASSIGQSAGNHKKGFAIGGGLGAVVLTVVLSILALLPLKIESLIKNIITREGSRVEESISRRTERLVLTYLAQKAGVNVGSGVVVDNGLLKTLYANWSKSGFDKKLAAQGITVEKGDAPGRIRVIHNGVATPSQSLDEFLNTDLSSSDARRFFRVAVNDQTKAIQLIRRRHMRRWLKNAAGIKKWSVFDRKTGKDPTTGVSVAETELDAALAENVNGKLAADLSSDESCALSNEECPQGDGERANPDGTDPARGAGTATESPAGCDKSDTTCTSELSEDQNTDKSGVVADGLKKYGGTAGQKLSDIITGDITKKIMAAGVGLGAVNIMADLDESLYDNSFGKLIETRRGEQYAAVFASWAIIADEIKDGKTVSGDEFNAAMKKLNGIEKAQSFSTIYENNSAVGEPMDPTKKVGSGGSADVANSVSAFYKANFGYLHPPLQAYKHSVGAILGAISSVISSALNPLLSVLHISDLFTFVSDYLGKLLNYVLGTVADGSETGAPLVNEIDAGADYTYNKFNNDTLGAPTISAAQAAAIDTQIAAENQADNARQPIMARIFSVDNPASLVNRIAASVPSTPSEATSRTGGFIAAIFTNPSRLFGSLIGQSFLHPAFAASTVDPYGITQSGYSDTQLAQPVDLPSTDTNGDGKIDENDCPVVKDASQPNLCLLDVATEQALESSTTGDDDGGVNSP